MSDDKSSNDKIGKIEHVSKSYILEDEMVVSESIESNVISSLINKQLKGRIVNIVNNSYKPYVCTLYKPDVLFKSFPMNDRNVE